MNEDSIYTSAYSGPQIDQMVKFCTNSIAEIYSTTKQYQLDDFVIYDGLLYQCIITAYPSAGEAWDASHWAIQKIFDNDGYIIINSVPGAE